MNEADDDRLPAALIDAVGSLRDTPAIRSEWRERVMARVAAGSSRRVHVTLPSAIAAAIAFMIAGAGLERLVVRGSTHGQMPTAIEPATRGSPLRPVRFRVLAPGATSVSIVGDFNGWTAGGLPMRRSGDGRLWTADIQLPLGRYSYGFLIDGHLVADPTAPTDMNDDFGAPNSVLMVRGS